MATPPIVKLHVIASLTIAFCVSEARAQITIVDIIPQKYQRESRQNSEPNIAVDPSDPTKIVVSAFGGSAAPIFISKDGGGTWAILQMVHAGDISIGWGGLDNAYLSMATTSGSTIGTFRLQTSTRRSHFQKLRRSNYRPHGQPVDQPWTEATQVGGVDHIYVAFNDYSQPTRTASIRQSLDGGSTWTNVVIERIDPGLEVDGAAVRVAANGSRVYGAFQRFNFFLLSSDTSTNVEGDIVVVRDDAAGAGGYFQLGASGAGTEVANSVILPQGYLGQERLGSDLSIAVDPNNPDRVALAYAVIRRGSPVVALVLSLNGGATWDEIYTTPPASALPAVAIAGNGAVGLLFTFYDGVFLETHFVQSQNAFATKTDVTLSRFADLSLKKQFEPYIGDYEDLVAVGNDFYGAFSASNDTSQFPQQPTFLRDTTLLGTAKVPFSIDPFFFKAPALP